ncbi:hypothetical protein niasHT_005915 [Heterodera trifolii]|uniref:UvrD-like helicase C-terminal domain-containing protein n=1 Tax=Heterodera trifolii TaxID=157864 RepID=A0ABD2LX60_9BILA
MLFAIKRTRSAASRPRNAPSSQCLRYSLGRFAASSRNVFEDKTPGGLKYERLQFPIKPAFAMTIQKGQGQTISTVGIDLEREVFTHGQLYTAFSRATDGNNVRVHAPKREIDAQGTHSAASRPRTGPQAQCLRYSLGRFAASYSLGRFAASYSLGRFAASYSLGRFAASYSLGRFAASYSLGRFAASYSLGRFAASYSLGRFAASYSLGRFAAS